MLFRTQTHAWFHLVATLGVIAAGISFQISIAEWCAVVVCFGMVWTAEAINTAIEFTVDLASPQHNKLAGNAKDVAAGAVLLASMASAVVALLVFAPHLLP